MKFFYRHKGIIAAVFLGVALAGAPTPAHAVGLDDVIAVLVNLVKMVTDGVSRIISGNTAGTQLQTKTDIDRTNFAAQEANRLALQVEQAKLANAYSDPSDRTCRLVATGVNEVAHEFAVNVVDGALQAEVSHAFISTESGDPIGMNKVLTCMCKLGAVGKKGECETESNPKLRIESADWNVGIILANHTCLEMDPPKVIQAITQCVENGTVPGDDDLKKSVAAVLSTRIALELAYGRIAGGQETKTATGLESRALTGSDVSAILASAGPIIDGLAYLTCPAKTLLNGCTEDEVEMRDVLQNVAVQDLLELPDPDYCLSDDLRRRAMKLIFQQDAANIGEGADDLQRRMAIAQWRSFGWQLDMRKDQIMAAAGAAAANQSDHRAPMGVPRPLGGASSLTSENDVKELMDSIRKLTRVLEQNSQSLPRALEVKAPPKKAAPGGKPEASNSATLPPLRADFPTVE